MHAGNHKALQSVPRLNVFVLDVLMKEVRLVTSVMFSFKVLTVILCGRWTSFYSLSFLF